MELKESIRYSEYRSPLGVVLMAGTPSGICAVSLAGGRDEFLRNIEKRYRQTARKEQNFFSDAFKELDIYFSGRPIKFTLPLDLEGTAFEKRVWQAIREIPWGVTRSYGEIARRAGSPAASRATGGACGQNPVPLIIPCHRVIAGNGALGGYTGGLDMKRMLLRIEGVPG